MDYDEADRINCCCEQSVDLDGKPVLIPTRECDLHWRLVIKADRPPTHLFP